MNIPQALGYTKIAGMPVVTGLYSLLLPLVGFAAFGSSRYLVVSADSATAAIFASGVSGMAPPASARYVALAGAVALLTAGFLLLARLLKLGFIADFLSQTVLAGFLTGVGFQVGIAVLGEMLGLEISASRTLLQLAQVFRKTAPSPSADLGRFRRCGRGSTAVSPLCAQSARSVPRGCWSHRGQRNLEFQRAWHYHHRPGGRWSSSSWAPGRKLERSFAADAHLRIVLHHDHHPECRNRPGLCGAPPAAVGRECGPGRPFRSQRHGRLERDLRRQRKSHPDRDGRKRGRPEPGGAACHRGDRGAGPALSHPAARIPAALRARRPGLHDRYPPDQIAHPAGDSPREPGRVCPGSHHRRGRRCSGCRAGDLAGDDPLPIAHRPRTAITPTRASWF